MAIIFNLWQNWLGRVIIANNYDFFLGTFYRINQNFQCVVYQVESTKSFLLINSPSIHVHYLNEVGTNKGNLNPLKWICKGVQTPEGSTMAWQREGGDSSFCSLTKCLTFIDQVLEENICLEFLENGANKLCLYCMIV